ncbi:MAG: hypothetical protein R2911_04085 [Caldilineaceae bacterium]
MSLIEIHGRLSNTASLFLAVLAVWAIVNRVRTRPLDGNWYGAAVIGELLLLAQFVLGWVLYFEGFGAVLPRSYLHILYGAVAVIALPPATCTLPSWKTKTSSPSPWRSSASSSGASCSTPATWPQRSRLRASASHSYRTNLQ